MGFLNNRTDVVYKYRLAEYAGGIFVMALPVAYIGVLPTEKRSYKIIYEKFIFQKRLSDV